MKFRHLTHTNYKMLIFLKPFKLAYKQFEHLTHTNYKMFRPLKFANGTREIKSFINCYDIKLKNLGNNRSHMNYS